MTVCNWLRPSPSLADRSHRAEQSGRRPYNRPASRRARWSVIIRARRPHEHAALMARRSAGYALGAAKVNGKLAGNPHQLRHGPVADGAEGGHSPLSPKRNRVDTHPGASRPIHSPGIRTGVLPRWVTHPDWVRDGI
jgi:hypothetical protein